MMAGTVVKKEVCRSCGVEVRETSSFCYACGETILAAVEPDIVSADTQILSGNGSLDQEAQPIEIEVTQASDEPAAEVISGKALQANEDNTKIRSAASFRRKAKAYNRKPVEIAWVQRERSPKAFVIVSIVLTVFAAVLLALALYLK